MRWKLLVFVSLVATLVACASWLLLSIFFFTESAAIIPLNGQLWPLTFVAPLLLTIFAAFFVYRHTSRKRKTQAVMTLLLVLTLTALICFAVVSLVRRRNSSKLPSPVLLAAPTQSLSAPALANRSQTECARPTLRRAP